jgi:prepilin-type N-terminal cleavage/methylation domain-containing protein
MSERPVHRDAGMTLPELVISIVIMGVLLAAASTAVMVTMRTAPQTERRVEANRDMSVVQSWLPLDLAAASEVNTDPVFDPATSTELLGTNVLSVRRASVSDWDIAEVWVSYRYLLVGEDWQLIRFEITAPGTASESVERVVVAHRLAAPPAGWTAGLPPTHAVAVSSNGAAGAISQTFELTFAGGQTFTAGGTELTQEVTMQPGSGLGSVDPAPPPSRCGGNVTLVIDTSGSVPNQRGGAELEAATTQFLDLFIGTPVQMSVIGFDLGAYNMAPTSSNAFIPMLNPSAEITAARDRILALDDVDGNFWTTDPNGDGIHWNQIGAATNWEAALRLPFFDPSGTPIPTPPELVVFITDGGANVVMPGSEYTDPTQAALAQANLGRQTGARIIGVIVGSAANNAWAVGNLKTVVGDVEFDVSANEGRGNAQSAEFFRAAFTNTAEALRTIVEAQCGGTITLQKKIDDGAGNLVDAPTRTVWTFSTDLGTQKIDRRKDSSVTLDYAFAADETSKSVRIVEESGPRGYVFDRIECMKQGATVDGRVTQPISSGNQVLAGADIELRADEALSCLVISRRS